MSCSGNCPFVTTNVEIRRECNSESISANLGYLQNAGRACRSGVGVDPWSGGVRQSVSALLPLACSAARSLAAAMRLDGLLRARARSQAGRPAALPAGQGRGAGRGTQAQAASAAAVTTAFPAADSGTSNCLSNSPTAQQKHEKHTGGLMPQRSKEQWPMTLMLSQSQNSPQKVPNHASRCEQRRESRCCRARPKPQLQVRLALECLRLMPKSP